MVSRNLVHKELSIQRIQLFVDVIEIELNSIKPANPPKTAWVSVFSTNILMFQQDVASTRDKIIFKQKYFESFLKPSDDYAISPMTLG